ncbi:3,4-dihydroxy-2-butanone-4-phosphate synthase [Flavobacterium tructae]|uniref:3,4-dihydroxy-2-butanone-4-phosphate synthase n=1 Tax=Flavobacterium TaxID=237 RepID=UPI000B5C079A|nr:MULTISPECIES: 3,4-dihydroxy-2-butanone-4-phosphate synthase [Flavobacterium]MDL2145157.1 3,4-dihydroxy-2-butanone-4-phosphate synthase [Flavobacterium tructae]OXB25017.1 3,4-dihydroxy-2-butanone-4-phosphate synthase [Flavobacterium tructae]URC11296.1 3,4-dihydroxy-2-butanone-4-phosphate synthase [Flavobacterium sp. B183]
MISTLSYPLEKFGLTSVERVENALRQLRNGKGILLTDDENRENEGDLIFSAQHINVQDMAMMIRECSGIVCLCLTNEKADQLELPYMVKENTSSFQTPFTITIEAKEGVTTGVSAADRITTIKTAVAQNAKPTDLAKPGHIFPLRAKNNGVLERNGHTEGSVDLMKLAGLKPEAVLCELMNEDGSMAKLDKIISFAVQHDLVVLSIEDIIYYRKYVKDYV